MVSLIELWNKHLDLRPLPITIMEYDAFVNYDVHGVTGQGDFLVEHSSGEGEVWYGGCGPDNDPILRDEENLDGTRKEKKSEIQKK